MSTHITREILKAASLTEQIEVGADDDDDDEDEELGGNPSGSVWMMFRDDECLFREFFFFWHLGKCDF